MSFISQLFSRLETIYAVNATIELYGAVMVIVAIATAIGMRLDKKVFNYVICAYVFTFISITCDAAAALLRGLPGENIRIWLYICNFFGMTGMSLCGYFYLNVLFITFKGKSEKVTQIFRIITTGLAVLTVVMLIVTQWTGWIYTIDGNNLYKRGDLFWLSSVYGALLIICAIVYWSINIRNFKKDDAIAIAVYIIIPSVGIVLQTIMYGSVLMQMALLVLMVIILFRTLMRHTKQLIEQKEKLVETEVSVERMREKMLISQVRPHFIYNSLTAIQRIEGNPPETIKAIDDFSKYLRINLSIADDVTTIPFEKEIEHIRTYIDIEKLRFGDELNVEFDIQDVDFQVPVLSIQVLVENAIKHGVMKKRGGGTVKISTYKDDINHIVEIKDNGVGFDEKAVPETGHIGIRSTRERLDYYVKGTLSIDSQINVGTTATIKIPIEP